MQVQILKDSGVARDYIVDSVLASSTMMVPRFDVPIPLLGANQGQIAYEYTSMFKNVGKLKYYNGIAWILIGDVTGPFSSVPGSIAIFDGASGKVITDSVVTIDNFGNIVTPGTITATNLSGINTGDVTIGTVNAGGDANGATIGTPTTQTLHLSPATATTPGILTAGVAPPALQQLGNGPKSVSEDGLSFVNTTSSYIPSFLKYYEEIVIQSDVMMFQGDTKAGFSQTGVLVPTGFLAPTTFTMRGSPTVSGKLILRFTRIGNVTTCCIPAFWVQVTGLIPVWGVTQIQIAEYGIIPNRFKPIGDFRGYCNSTNNTDLGSQNGAGSTTPDSGQGYWANGNWVSQGQEQSNIVVRAPDNATRWPTSVVASPPVIPYSINWPDIFMYIVNPPPASFTTTVGTGLYEDVYYTWLSS